MENSWSSVAIFIALYYLISKTVLKKHENLPPSPFPSLPIIGHFHIFKEPVQRNLAQLAAGYGPILLLRLGARRILLISSSSAAEDCLVKNDVVFANRPALVLGEILGYNYTTVTWAPFGDHWRNLCRISTTEILSQHRLNLLAGIRVDEVKLLLRRIHGQISSSDGGVGVGKVNMQSMLLETVNNVMMRMIAGKRYFGGECEETEEARRFRDLILTIESMVGLTTIRDFFPALSWFSTRQEKKFRAAFKEFDEFVQELVDQQRRKMELGEDCDRDGKKVGGYSPLIEVLLSMQKTDPEFCTEEVVRGLVLVLILAGTGPSAATVEWALSLLLNNPSILNKAQNEIDEVVGHDRLIDESDLKNLLYLRCIIKETLRMYPVTPLFMRNSSKDDNNVTVGGYHVPNDTMVMVNVWAIQNDPKVWDDPSKFRPERFEEEVLLDTKGGGGGGNSKVMAFGAGRRVCPGEGLAMRLIGLILGSVLQCFEWENSEEGEMVEMAATVGYGLFRVNPLIAKCKTRGRKSMLDLFLA